MREFELVDGPISEQDQTESSTGQNDDTAAPLIHFRKTRKTATKPEAVMHEEST